MKLEQELDTGSIFIQTIKEDVFDKQNIILDVLRLDKIHPVVSGNKWFKLKYWMQQAIKNKYNTLATFGGAFSNHILATAYACKKQNIKCIGFIRGEEPKYYSDTLLDACALNMQLKFLSRRAYAEKESIIKENNPAFFIPEGGYGKAGAKGAGEILEFAPDISTYNYIICAAGTGTMLAGIANAGKGHQQYIGISVMKNNLSLEKEIYSLVDEEPVKRLTVLHDYHFGGYAKYTQQLIDFMNSIWTTHKLPLDFVYTAKALHAVYQLAEQKYFPAGVNILFIHSGGLQGNRSLPEKVLRYHE